MTDETVERATPRDSTTKKVLIAIGALAVIGAVTGIGLLVAFPSPTIFAGGMAINFLKTLGAPAGTLSTESNPAYKAAETATPSAAVEAPSGTTVTDDWPSYNRTLSSDRFSPLSQINTTNVGKLRILCTYKVGEFTSFESGLIVVNNAMIGTTEHDTFSINPATCAENWRAHESYRGGLLPAIRGAAYLDGMLFRGTSDGRALAYDFKTGKLLWETTLGDFKLGESTPAAPIAYDGLVYIGTAGGDYKGGKGHMFALDAKSGKIVWEFFLAPKQAGDIVRGPLGATPLDTSTWPNAPGIPISGGGTWTSTTLDTKTGALYVPGGNPAPDFAAGVRTGESPETGWNLFTDSVVVLDSKTGNYRYHINVAPKDWHDWDVSNPPIAIQTRGGRQLLVVAPKNGYLYGFDLANSNQILYRVPVTRHENEDVPFSRTNLVYFCPGATGGMEWFSPSYIPTTNLILTAEVDWCTSAIMQDTKQIQSAPLGKPWSGMATLNPGAKLGKRSKADGYWSGWVYATDADTGVWKWRTKSNYPFVGGMTPTAGGVVFVGDAGGNFYALDSSNGQKLWNRTLDGAVGGGVITYTANGAQKVAVAYGFTHPEWPTIIRTAKITVLGLDEGALPNQ
jgi:alcohol dehydrogenase (cytochrome c)